MNVADLIFAKTPSIDQGPIQPWIDELTLAIKSICVFSSSGTISKWNESDLYDDLETKDSEYMRWPRLENFMKMSNPNGAKMKSIRLYKPLEDEKFVEGHGGEKNEIRVAGMQIESATLFGGVSKQMHAVHLDVIEHYKTLDLGVFYDK